jgi:hypothetical protein
MNHSPVAVGLAAAARLTRRDGLDRAAAAVERFATL